MNDPTHMANMKTARAPKTPQDKKRFSLVPASAQYEMFEALARLARSKARPASGAEVAEIAICLAAGDGVPVIRAGAANGARLVRGNSTTVKGRRRRLEAATIASVAALLEDAKAWAVVVCAGKIDAGSEAHPENQADYRNAFHFAARYKLPILFVVANRLGAKREQRLDLRTLYAEFGIPVFSVDAQDAIAAYRVATEALHNAKHHRGPCVIEALTLPSAGGGQVNPRELLAAYMERHGNPPR
jgi:hypothetical protein